MYFGISRLINYIDTKAKCRNLTKINVQRDFAQLFICRRPRTLYPPPPYTVYVYTTHYTYSQREGERVEQVRRGVGQHRREPIPKLGWKYQHDWMYTRNWLSPVCQLWWTPAAKSLYMSFFSRWRQLPSTSLIFLRVFQTVLILYCCGPVLLIYM